MEELDHAGTRPKVAVALIGLIIVVALSLLARYVAAAYEAEQERRALQR